MDRRTFVQSMCGSTALVAATGCIGVFDDETDQLESEIEDLEDTIESQDEEIDDLEGDIAALEDEIDDRDDAVAELENELADSEAEFEDVLVSRYARMDTVFEVSEDWLEAGEDHLDAEDFHEAARLYSGASRYLDAAAFAFEGVEEVAADHGYDRAAEIPEEAAIASELLREATWHLSEASRELGLGNDDAAEDHFDEADEWLEILEEYEVADEDEFRDALED